MGMTVGTNIMALNANNSLNKASNMLNSNMSKLASGSRINKAADDASGLSISEKMKAQIKALDTASDNCKDGANLIQTAEGYMSETHDMLNRMVELAEKSANGVLDDTDRDALQNEMDQLCAEVDRIATTANFNGKKLLDGSLGSTAAITLTSTAGQPIDYSYTENTANGIKLQIGESSTTADKMDVSVNSFHSDALFSCVNGFVNRSNDTSDTAATATGGTRRNYTEADASLAAAVTTAETARDTAKTAYDTTALTTYTGTNAKAVMDAIGKTTGSGSGGVFTADDIAGKLTQIKALDSTNIDDDAKALLAANASLTLYKAAETAQAAVDAAKAANVTGSSTYKNAISVDITDKDKASAAADALRQVTNYVSDERGKLGAQQNRLEHTVNNLTTASENTTAANGRIVDTDMAKTMIAYTQKNVLSQAAQAMLAQANTQPQSVLQLLQ